MEWKGKEEYSMRKTIVAIAAIILLSGCATGSLKIDPENIRELQKGENGTTTSGCIATKLNASSGIVGGDARAVITWGENIAQGIIDWCTGQK